MNRFLDFIMNSISDRNFQFETMNQYTIKYYDTNHVPIEYFEIDF